MLRRWRDRVVPTAVGVPVGNRRRATGLRREELAALAGISADYLTRLEQGRATSPSAQVVESLARALRLSDSERDLIYRLAGHATPGREVIPSRITASVQRLLDRFENIPVAVYDAANTLLVANAPYNALMGDTTALRGIERNAVWRNFVGSGNRAVLTPTAKAHFERTLVADLRMTASRYPADRTLSTLVSDLTAQSPRFAELWTSSATDVPLEQARHKVVNHPTVGPIAVDCDTLVVAGDDIRIMVFTAEPGSHDADLLALALVVGTQELVE